VDTLKTNDILSNIFGKTDPVRGETKKETKRKKNKTA
jgi:hypothetical protein